MKLLKMKTPPVKAILIAFGLMAHAAFAANTRVVDPEKGPYTTIQAAIDAADPGDTIEIAAGEYGTDGASVANDTFGPSRVVVNKANLTLKGAGRDKTFIVGATTGGKTGNSGVRGILVTANGVKVSDLTVRSGGTANVDGGKGIGGGLCSNATGTEIVDCNFFGCVAKGGASLYCNKSDGMTAVRCRCSTGSDVTAYNPIVHNTALYFCILDHHINTGGYFVGGTQPMVHCTVSNVALHHMLGDDSPVEVCNSVLGSYSYRFGGSGTGKTGGYAYNVVSEVGEKVVAALGQNDACKFGEKSVDFVSTIKGDYRLTVSSPAVGAASADLLARIPEAYRNKDYFGNPVDPENLHCGAVQETVDVPTCRLEFALPNTTDTLTFDGFTEACGNTSLRLYDHALTWPVYHEVSVSFASGAPFWGFTSDDGVSRFPLTDGRYVLMPPPRTAAAVKLTARAATQVLWVDEKSAAAEPDGTSEESAFKNIQDAVDAVTENNYAIVKVKKGTYDQGGANTSGSLNNRVQINNRFVRLVGVDGAEETFLVGAADPAAIDPALEGCGTGGTRCLFSDKTGAIQGFTLTGGRAGSGKSVAADHGAAVYATAPFSVLDCIVSNNVSGRASIAYGSSDSSQVTVLRSKILENGANFSGYYARFSNFASCLVAYNRHVTGSSPYIFEGAEANVFDSTFFTTGDGANGAMGGATFGSVTTDESGAIIDATGSTWRNSLVCGYLAFRNNKAYGCVVDKQIVNSGNNTETYVVNLMGTEGVDWLALGSKKATRAGFVDYENMDFRLRADSVSLGYARYDAVESPNAYKFATCDLDGVFPDLSAPFAPGAYRTPIPVVSTVDGLDGQTITPALTGAAVEPGTELTFTVSPTRPFLGFTVDGELQEYTGTSFAWTVPEGPALHVISARYDNNWFVATDGSDTAIGNAQDPVKTLKEAIARTDANDVVNVRPGHYTEGKMDQSAYWTVSGPVTVLARVVVPKNRTLVSTDGPEVTFIEGEAPTNPDAYGCGPDGVRCVVLDEFAVLKGFTVTNGHADDPGSESENSRGGGIYGRNGNSQAYDCIVSNNCARQGGGAFIGSFTRCRFTENRGTGNGSALRNASCYDCYVGGNRGWATLYMCNRFIGSTFDADNVALDGATTSGIANMGAPRLFENAIVLAAGFANDNKNDWYFTNCIVRTDVNCPGGRDLYKFDADTVEKTVEEVALDGFGVPTAGASYACDRGRADLRAKYASLYYADDTIDCARHPRYVNGGRLDIGCYEADWKALYSRKLGHLATVTAADPLVELTVDGVRIPAGASLSATMAKAGLAGLDCSFEATVADGELAVAKDGDPWRTLTSASDVRQKFVADADSMAFDFTMGDAGSAVLGRFRREIGAMLIVR